MSQPQAPAAPTITRDPRRLRVLFGGHEVGDSADVLIVRERGEPPTLYLPRSDVEMAVLTRTGRETSTPSKGVATWFTVYRDGHVVEDAAWSFETPPPAYQAIARRIAFRDQHFEFAEHGQTPADWMLEPAGLPSAEAHQPATHDAVSFANASVLASALRRAAAAHHDYQSQTGAADPDWPDWYAAYIAATPAS